MSRGIYLKRGKDILYTVVMEKVEKGIVVLFRAPKDGEVDLYDMELKKEGFRPFSVPVLDFNFVNLDILFGALTRSKEYSGIILTSPRAVEACSVALQKLSGDEKQRKECLNLPSYCVGPSTQQQAGQLGFSSADCEAGNADKLAKYIVEHNTTNIKPLLYPCGNLRRDTLSVKLKAEGFSLEEIVVYETVKSKTIKDDVEKLIELHGVPKYIVYFSPSGVQYTADLYENGILQIDDLKLVAIGSTTEAELEKNMMSVAATAKSPSHTGVSEALLQICT